MTAPALVAENANAGLKVVNLRKSYKNRLIIRDVTLDLARGEVVGLLGPNGSGKTTSFYAIAGLILPEAGQVIIDGQDVTDLPMYRRARLGIGYLPQEASIFRQLSVKDNLLAILETRSDLTRKARLKMAGDLLDEFNVGHLADALGLEAGNDFLRVHARLDDFQGNPAFDRLFLLGQIDQTHTAFANQL